MNLTQRNRFLKINNELIEEGKSVVASKFNTNVIGAPTFVDLQKLHRWWGKVKSFGHQLGLAAKPWQEVFSANPERNTLVFALTVIGTLEAIAHEFENDHLETFSGIIRAETLADLIEQGEHLLESGYHLAAGVIGRAVLEEHLRSTCANLNCTPTKKRPTINDFNMALYGLQHYTKVKMKQIDVLATIGNNAAHNSPDLDPSDVKKLLADLPELIESTRV
ncbi:MAG: hypothetical protein K9N21_19195 [Deltaproteobacteria bacterium]|nr:hypothetical protein [Deltaproteobacteria bacterium]